MNKEEYIDTILLENDRLYKENNQLKEQIEELNNYCDSQDLLIEDLRKDYAITKELRNWLEEEIKHLEHSRYVSFNEFGERKLYFYKEVLSKLNELEGGKNE